MMIGGEEVKLNRKIRVMLIVFSVMFITISVEFLWDIRQTEKANAPYQEIEHLTEYTINMKLIQDDMRIQASERVVYTNQQEKALKDIYFHLYPNAFKSKNKVPFEEKEMERAYPNGFNPGYIEVINVKQGRKKVAYKIMGETSTILRVTPTKPVEPGEEIELSIDFLLKLPNTIGRMGYGEDTINITNWFPIVAVYDQRGWNLDPYYAIGDPFYSEVANYYVTATLPKDYLMASTGKVVKTQEKGQTKIYEIEAPLVRNFVMILSEGFDVKEAMVDGTKVLSYSIDGLKGEEALQYGVDALKIFNSLLEFIHIHSCLL